MEIRIGDEFGRLTVLRDTVRNKNRRLQCICRCVCGEIVVVLQKELKCGRTKSCGCLQRDRARISATTHGRSKTPLYRVWCAMKNRCLNPKVFAFPDYGGRGITVCGRWMSFESFLADMGNCPKGMTLERLDNNKGYSPENCKWVSRGQQARNKRNNRLFTINGVTKCRAEWIEQFGINRSTFDVRIKNGWSVFSALSTPPHKKRKSNEFNGTDEEV